MEQEVIKQKLAYIHNNQLECGFVIESKHWKYSSTMNYAGGKDNIDLIFNVLVFVYLNVREHAKGFALAAPFLI